MIHAAGRSLVDLQSGTGAADKTCTGASIRLLLALLVGVAVAGCAQRAEIAFTNAEKPLSVQLIQPAVRKIVRVVGQPSFIESYERTSIYPKPSAYIKKWIVDIGDKVKKGDLLATLYAPELVEELETKKADVVLDREKVRFANENVEVAKADVKAAEARLKEAEEILSRYQSEVERWDVEVKRLKKEAATVVVDPRVLFESTNQLESATAARTKAVAAIKRANAELRYAQAALGKARVEVRVAEAALKVAESEEKYAKAWVDYLTLSAPFDGVITARNANTFDFVLPTIGDPTAFYLSPDISPGGGAAPIYVVDRTDIVRVFVDVPEYDANDIRVGTKASVVAKAYRDEPIKGTVTRVSWALNQKSRTLRVEVDLKNPESKLLPGTYAYVDLMIERPGVRALPESSVFYSGDSAFYWQHENGHAVRTEVRTGVSDGEWIEVTNRRVPAYSGSPSGENPWVAIDGTEQVILGELSLLSDGAKVEVAQGADATKVVTEMPASGPVSAVSRPPVSRAAPTVTGVQ
jgi:multidrug efflux pump subunit AcrA (membrane-fusion protein)